MALALAGGLAVGLAACSGDGEESPVATVTVTASSTTSAEPTAAATPLAVVGPCADLLADSICQVGDITVEVSTLTTRDLQDEEGNVVEGFYIVDYIVTVKNETAEDWVDLAADQVYNVEWRLKALDGSFVAESNCEEAGMVDCYDGVYPAQLGAGLSVSWQATSTVPEDTALAVWASITPPPGAGDPMEALFKF
ncbi:MAG: hypothetical protein LBR19_04045 [Bifidobacteriaceae bacterium]|jgi:hypothetical protein|nr:hypothetical protein [Bifidobacteriaceae bacterium]